MKTFYGLLAVYILLNSNTWSASVIGAVGSHNFYDVPGYPVASSGLPHGGFGGYNYWDGTISIDSDPDEDINSIVILFTKNPGQEHLTGGDGFPMMGRVAYLGNNGNPAPLTIEHWETSWYSFGLGGSFGYSTSGYNGIFARPIYGTANIVVNSSLGEYVAASYGFSYIGVIPEPSTVMLLLAGVVVCFRRRRIA